MHRVLAIARLTWKSAFGYRLFWVMAALLVGAVVGLPLALIDVDTAEGLAEILLTYTLSAISVLLGISTLWLSCGTLAKDVEDCQIQVVCTKPVARWQIWVGKWLGILALNAMLLAISGTAVFFLIQWRAQRLPADQQAKLRNEVFVGRAAAKERPPDIRAEAKRRADIWLRDWQARNPTETFTNSDEIKQISNQILAQVRSEWEEVGYRFRRWWRIDLSSLPARVRSQPMQLRFKFHVADPNPAATYPVVWWVGPTNSPNAQFIEEALPPDSFQEINISPQLDAEGMLDVVCGNPNETSLFFPIEDGFEVLYRESSFGVNFARGLAVLLCWLGLLSALGLASASFLSFPVAAFCSLAVLMVGLSTSTLSAVQENKSIFPYDSQGQPGPIKKFIDSVSVPVFGAILKVVTLVEDFSPVDDLSTGHSVTWGQVARAVGQIVFLMGGFFAAAGILLLNRRELAAVQANA